jgi:glycosyltransferase involved in cell wall biosynthesis
MKKVCFVMHTDLFTPWPVVRAVREIEVLKEHGYDISAVCWIKNMNQLAKNEEKDGVSVHRIFMQPPKNSAPKRILAFRKILADMSNEIVNLKPDAIVCHDLEILKAGVSAKRKLGVPLFFDAHENWPDMVAQNSKLEASYFSKLEKKLLHHVVHSYTYGNDLTEKYTKMGFLATTLYNSKSVEDIPKIDESECENIRRRLGIDIDDFVVGFSGSVSLKNGAQQVIDAQHILHKNFVFLVVGGSGRKEDLEGVKKHALKNDVNDRVIFTGRVPPDDLLRYTKAMDVGTALFQPLSENEKVRIPNKIFDYMAMEVPMIVSDFPNMRKIVVDEAHCGMVVNPMNVKEITKAILHFQENPKEAQEQGKRGRKKFEDAYSWNIQKKKLTESHPIWRGEL